MKLEFLSFDFEKFGDHRREEKPIVVTDVPEDFVKEMKSAQAEVKTEEEKA